MLPNNNDLVRKIGTNKTQVLRRMRMHQLTPGQPPANIRITAHEYKPDPDMSLKHDDLYARAWVCDYEQPFFDADNNLATHPNSTEIPIQPDVPIEEMKNTPGTAHECFSRIFSSNGRIE